MPPDPIITTERLLLRSFEEDDLDALAEMYGDAETMRFITGKPRSREETKKLLIAMRDRVAEVGHGLMATVLRETGELVGRCGFYTWSIELLDETEIGWLVKREHWGKGLATEVGIALRDYGFEVLGHQRLISVIDPLNLASIRVAQKVGEHPWKGIEHEGRKVLVYAVERP